MPERLPWNRWICPREKTIRFDTDDYPEDPGGRYATVLQPHCVALESILDARCGVVLGEAGIGKSDALRQLETILRSRARGPVLKLDLGEYSDTSELAADLFDSPRFRAWQPDDTQLDLLLDSLDEGMAGVRNIVGLLQRRLRDLPFERLHLYLSCRTTAWPETLTAHLIECFGDEHAVTLYQLVPLLRRDVELAARALEIEPQRFLTQVDEHNAQALACNPLTLQLLLNVFDSTGFPASSLELLERGLLALCEAPPARRDRGTAPPYTAAQLLTVASRVAALALLSGRAVIETATDTGTPRLGVQIGDCVGGDEGDADARVAVDEAAVRATLTTGLFNGRGPDRFGFAHKTYGEFLAARFLAGLEMPAAQLDSLLCLQDRTPVQYVPQLHEVIAWLASFDGRFLQRVAQTEPEILLAADLPAEDGATRARIVDAILERTEGAEISYKRRRDLAPQLRRLAHPSLASQLGATIANRGLSDATREIALTMAEQCQVDEVADAAAAVALDATESFTLRVDAGYAVCRLRVPHASARLKPLAFLRPEEDSLDELRGLALRACWPEYMTAAELFEALRCPQRSNFSGSYSGFLRDQEIAEQIAAADLPTALNWVAQQNLDREYWQPLPRLAGEIVMRAWHEGSDELLNQLAPIVYRAYHDFQCPFFMSPQGERFATSSDTTAVNAMLESDSDTRRRLIDRIVRTMPEGTPFHLLVHSECPLVRQSDFGWLLDQACRPSGKGAVDWAKLARRVMNWIDVEHLDLWLRAIERCPVVAAVLDFPRVIEIDSPEGRQMKAEYLREQRRQRSAASRHQITPAAQAERIERILTQSLTDRPELFAALAAELHRELSSGRVDHVPADLRTTRGWQVASEEARSRIVDAAAQYLFRSETPSSDPLSTLASWVLADEAPALALLLLIHERPAAINAIPDAVWERRTGHVLVRLVGFFESSPGDKDAICTVIHTRAPNECRAVIRAILNDPSAADHVSSVVALWERRLDETLASDLFERLGEPQLAEPVFTEILRWLLRENYEPVIRYVDRVLEGTLDSRRLSTAVIAARERPERFWSMIWRLIAGDREWGRTFIATFLSFADEGGHLLPALTAEETGQLLGWLLTEYPPLDGEDTPDGVISTRDHVRFFRSAVIERLRQAGTREACIALRAIRDAHSEHPWLAEVLLEAQAAERRSSWIPPAPTHLRRLFADRRARFIDNTTQLLNVSCESLHRLAERLHGELPARTALWNDLPGGAQRPKDEEFLSDTVARHLRDDLADRGLVVNREVQIRRREVSAACGGQPGQLTDIRVDAAATPSQGREANVLTVIVEVKGCWNRDVRSAIRDQLVDRYLRDNQCQTGIYLVGWFSSPGWDQSDKRVRQVPWRSKEEAEVELVARADALSDAARSLQIRSYVLDCALP